MNEDCLKLTTYFGERDRADGGFLADALTEIYARHELQTSLVLRGMEGFGPKQHLRTDRLLTLSEDLPLVSVAVDTRKRIEAVLTEVDELHSGGLVTLERALMVTGSTTPLDSRGMCDAATKLTVYVGRQERIAGTPAYQAVVELLHRARHRRRDRPARRRRHRPRRPRTREASSGATRACRSWSSPWATPRGSPTSSPTWRPCSARPLLTLERVRVCKRDGERLAEPRHLPERDDAGLGIWQKLMVYTGEQAHVDGQPLHAKLVRDLRAAGAAGATSLRGIWGYHGDHQPHGDSLWQLRRRVPIVTVIVDTPERIRTWFTIVDQHTRETGLVTSEMVPAYRATTSGRAHGGLRLARGLTRE